MPPATRRLAARAAGTAVFALLLLSSSGIVAPAPALADPVRAAGPATAGIGAYAIDVPAGWPVVDLAAEPTRCVRFDVHAVYVGHPGDAQQCPTHPAGITEAILVEPDDATSRARLDATAITADAGQALPAARFATDGSPLQVVVPDAGVVVTATFRDDPATVQRTLDGARLTGAPVAAAPAAPATAPGVIPGAASVPGAASATAAAAPVVTPAAATLKTGHGISYAFDTCATPGVSAMTAWLQSPYRTAGVYLGGRNFSCPSSKITASWVTTVAGMGWGIVPIYVGYQAPYDNCGCASMSATKATAATQGTNEGNDAAGLAAAAALPAGNTLYFDMEGYTAGTASCTSTSTSKGCVNSRSVMAYLSNWTKALHAKGYRSGVYSSSASGIVDIVRYTGTSGFVPPDDIWMANWNGKQSVYGDSFVADGVYRGFRMHQFSGGHDETWGGVTVNIDSNVLDGDQDCAGGVCPSAIAQHYAALGGAASALKAPVGAEGVTAAGVGRTQSYQGGAIVLGLSTSSNEVHGDIYKLYKALGGTRSVLAFPTTDTRTARDGFSRYSSFQGGIIVYSGATGAHEIHGSIQRLWQTLGSTLSALRLPVTDQTPILGGTAQMNGFQLGAIYWSSSLGAHEVHGALYSAYLGAGGPAGSLGLPTSNTYSSGSLRKSNFQHGTISYNPATGRTTVTLT